MTMEDLHEPRILGRTGLKVGRLGVSGGYGAPAAAFEGAFERGCNYFYHGSFRKPGMTLAIKNIVARGRRDDLVVVVQSYTRLGFHLRWSVRSFLRLTGLDHADVLLLGWHNGPPSRAILDSAEDLRRQGQIRHLAVSGHNRPAFPEFARDSRFGAFHLRYNAAHPGAETDVFPLLPAEGRPGVVAYTATSWGHLFDPGRTPAGEATPRASDCYRFVLSHPAVDVCMTGPSSQEHMDEALATLDRGPMSAEELAWMRRIGAKTG
jgi:aryl-alcohol dehydrogenase-like predicted oxidoreductase